MATASIKDMNCCGTKEICRVSYMEPESLLRKYAHSLLTRVAHVFFTDINANSRSARSGFRFAAYIRRNRLGRVTKCVQSAINPNSGNRLTAWIWTVDHANLRSHLIQLDEARAR